MGEDPPSGSQAVERLRLGQTGMNTWSYLHSSVQWAAAHCGPLCGIFSKETLYSFLTVFVPVLTVFHCWDAGRM